MNSEDIKALIDEVKISGEEPLQRAQLIAQFLQAYHLAKISERFDAVHVTLQSINSKL